MDRDFDQAACARAGLRLNRHAVELVGHVKVPGELDGRAVRRDAFVIKAVQSVALERPGHRPVRERGLVVGGHIVDRGIVAVVGKRSVAVQIYALDDARCFGHAVVVQVDVYRLVGFGGRCSGCRSLRQGERQQERSGRQPAQFIWVHHLSPPWCCHPDRPGGSAASGGRARPAPARGGRRACVRAAACAAGAAH